MLSSKPHSLRIASIWASRGCLPAIRSAGSPFGITWKMKNVSTGSPQHEDHLERPAGR